MIFRGNVNVNPSCTAAENHYELDDEPPEEKDAHEAVNTSEASATTNDAPENTSVNDNNEVKAVNRLILLNDGFQLERNFQVINFPTYIVVPFPTYTTTL